MVLSTLTRSLDLAILKAAVVSGNRSRKAGGQTMKTMGISEFKATCIATLKAVQKQRTPLLVTWRGKPLAMVEPCAAAGGRRRQLGAMRGEMAIQGDIVHGDGAGDWESLS